jgi:putative membrane protein
MITAYALATLNACFNTAAATLMVLGYLAIKRGERQRHKRLMLGAFVASCLFLTSYLTRMVMFGDTRFTGEGLARVAYLTLLVSHVVLALAAAPMVIATLTLGLEGRFDRHKRIARVTLPIWAYVSVTGVIVYVALYHLQ